jgi:2-haloacid dehalogenase
LKDAGWTLATLTNSTRAAAEGSLVKAGLAELFNPILTVESVEKFKPHPAVYRMASEALGTPLDQMWMVASHDWDLAGAAAVRMKTAFVRRPGLPWAPHYQLPDLDIPDFLALAESLT